MHDGADLFLVDEHRHEKHRVRRGVPDFLRARGRGHVRRERSDDERAAAFLRLDEDAVDVLALTIVLEVGARGEIALRDDLAVAPLTRHPHRAALRLERCHDALEKIPEELPAVAAGARQLRDLSDVLTDLDASLLEEFFLFER